MLKPSPNSIDFTQPYAMRKEALNDYMFQCQCARCTQNLNIYQVRALSLYDNINHRLSVVADPAAHRNHPGALDPTRIQAIESFTPTAIALISESPLYSSSAHQRRSLRRQLDQCRNLIALGLWAISPIPDLLVKISLLYAEEGDFVSALIIRCQVEIACEPFSHVSPFNPLRVLGLITIARLLCLTADKGASPWDSPPSSANQNVTAQTAQELLQTIDQVSLCQMLSYLVLKSLPVELEDGSIIAIDAQQILGEIEQLPGRERETSLIQSWVRNPMAHTSAAFFEYAVVKPIENLAALASGPLSQDFGI